MGDIKRMKKKLIESFEEPRNVEFNTGFITAIALFLEHKNFVSQISKDKEVKAISDTRLYAGTDHLYEMEIPENIPKEIKKRISVFRRDCFRYRVEATNESKVADKLFMEAEDILAEIDETIFNTKTIIMNYR